MAASSERDQRRVDFVHTTKSFSRKHGFRASNKNDAGLTIAGMMSHYVSILLPWEEAGDGVHI